MGYGRGRGQAWGWVTAHPCGPQPGTLGRPKPLVPTVPPTPPPACDQISAATILTHAAFSPGRPASLHQPQDTLEKHGASRLEAERWVSVY